MNPWLKVALWDETKHFVFSAFAGLGAYYLTWTMLWPLQFRAYLSHGKTWRDTPVGFCIGLWPWLAGFSAGFAAHLLQDGLF